MKRSMCALALIAWVLTTGCRQSASPPPPGSSATGQGRWQVVAFQPSDDTDADGAILLDTVTGQTYVLCEYATAWCKLERPQ